MLRAGRKIALVFTLILVATIFSGCGVFEDVLRAFQVSETWTAEYTLEAGTPITLSNRGGTVDIRPAYNSNVLSLEATKRSWLRSALGNVEIVIDQEDEFTVITQHAESFASASVDWVLRVPTELHVREVTNANGYIEVVGSVGDLSVQTSNGNIVLVHVEGYIDATTSNGNVTVSHCTGIDGIRTSNGSIDVDIPSTRRDVSIRTSNGSIRARIARDLDVRVSAETSNGSVSSSDDLISIENSSRTSLTGNMGGGDLGLNIRSSNGSISLSPMRR